MFFFVFGRSVREVCVCLFIDVLSVDWIFVKNFVMFLGVLLGLMLVFRF